MIQMLFYGYRQFKPIYQAPALKYQKNLLLGIIQEMSWFQNGYPIAKFNTEFFTSKTH